MVFTDFNSLGIDSIEVTYEPGIEKKAVRTTYNAGMIMWSEKSGKIYRTYVASAKSYTKAGGVIPEDAYLGGDSIPYNHNLRARYELDLDDN